MESARYLLLDDLPPTHWHIQEYSRWECLGECLGSRWECG